MHLQLAPGAVCNEVEVVGVDGSNWSSDERAEAASRYSKRKEHGIMGALDWSQCPAVESVPGRLNGAWVFRDTRMPVSAVFQNLEAGATVGDITEWFDIPKDQIIEVLEFAARSVAAPVPGETVPTLDARPV